MPTQEQHVLAESETITKGITPGNNGDDEVDPCKIPVPSESGDTFFDADSEFEATDEVQNDLLGKIPNTYRLLKTLYETGLAGQGGLVEKIVIDQESLGLLLNKMLPGSYQSISSIDFKSLDMLSVKPKGVYGCRSEIAKFLLSMHIIDEATAQLLSQPDDRSSVASGLHSGLYLVLPPDQEMKDKAYDVYLIYWPEDTTWCDNANSAVQQNRVTFMRYLTQLSDQIIALVSEEQAAAFVWDSGTHNPEAHAAQEEDDDDDDARMFTFEVQKSEDQEENVTSKPGFKVELPPKLIDGKHVELIGGETTVGLLLSSVVKSKRLVLPQDDEYNALRLRSEITKNNVALGDQLTNEELEILRVNGLEDKYPSPFAQHKSRIAEAASSRDKSLEAEMQRIQRQLEQDQPAIEQYIRNITRRRSREFRIYAKMGQAPNDESAESISAKYPPLEQVARGFDGKEPMALIRCPRFQELKTKILVIREHFHLEKRNREEQTAIIQKILQEPLANLAQKDAQGGVTNIVWRFFTAVFRTANAKDKDSDTARKSQSFKEPSDLEFLSSLNTLIKTYPTLSEPGAKVIRLLQAYLTSIEDQFADKHLNRVLSQSKKDAEVKTRSNIDFQYDSRKRDSWGELWKALRAASTSLQSSSSIFVVNFVKLHKEGRKPADTIYHMKTTHITLPPPKTRYSFYPLQLTREDTRSCQSDSTFVPRPIIPSAAVFAFKLGQDRFIEFIQPMHDKCLIIIASHGESYVFMNRFVDVEGAIDHNGFKIPLNHERLGGKPIYAYDEITRILAVCHGRQEYSITWFAFDEHFSSLKWRGTLLLNYETHVHVESICFVAGRAELCIIDSSRVARVLSLVSEQFGSAYLQIDAPVHNAFSAPDGSCLFVTVGDPKAGRRELRAYHWSSFGPGVDGFNPACVDARSTCLVMGFERRSQTYLVEMDLSKPHRVTSVALHVKQKSAKFDFKTQETRPDATNQQTLNNCLMDCHMEVWSRFPVLPAVPRNTLLASVREPPSITFVSVWNFAGATDYFAKLVATLERTTQKPTGGKLYRISVGWASSQPLAVAKGLLSSCFHFGGFVVELLCLIPIQLAITRENNFIPLRNGVLDQAFERRLLGADVSTIINSLSIGWYESLFQSYMATKPVRVVSSMGEQSVGKSYCLNHFADTSFAGSAMRTTEGVWLSCTPTDEYLLVSLDFEGVQSIERSAQEDTLLVLFNAAVSNMVLFRNNFAISRNIAGLFKSFQSSAVVLDPQLNPEIFNSDLAIIIKDVITSDAKDIVREFSQKFQHIVNEEQEQNFISRLHRGRLHIIPWPVIRSRGFYTLFQRIREALQKQPITHGGAGVFLHMLKTLMAKIKVNDWGALDQNLAAHRAQQLAEWLPDVLGRGRVELSSGVWYPMKDIDTDQETQHNEPVSDDIFWVASSQGPFDDAETTIEQSLAALIQKHSERTSPRHTSPEERFISILQAQIYRQFDRRVEQVRDWVSVNTKRFPQENQDIRDLLKTLENTILTARTALQICASKCSSCHLLCLRPYRHTSKTEHDCGTDHACVSSCEVAEEHDNLVRCGLPSGHDGRHLCESGKHTCGQQCSLWGRNGCETACVKEIDHTGGHLCSARVHCCSKPCDLQNATQRDGVPLYSCPGLCQIPWDQDHERHVCSNGKSCPIECQLCPRLCFHDHFHGLEPGSVHLCGQEHRCTMFCEAPGICQIETQPSAILERFSGRYESFQYTRYSQEKRRLTCAIQIGPGQLNHGGMHTLGTKSLAARDLQPRFCGQINPCSIVIKI